MSLRSMYSQTFPGKPKYTTKDVTNLAGKVIIVTGSNTGIGKELAQMLYSKNAKIYMMARSEAKTLAAIDSIRTAIPNSEGEMIYLPLDLADLPSIKLSAQSFLAKETKLDILFNNAGVAYPDKGSKTAQGFELQLGVNCLGSFTFTKYLTPILASTAKISPPNTTRVVWVSSSAAEAFDPKKLMAALPVIEDQSGADKYFISKLGNYLHNTEFAARNKAAGVVSVSLNPGNLRSDLWRSVHPFIRWLLEMTVLYPPVYGASTLLYAGLSPDVTLEKTGSHIAPWGRLWTVSKDMANAAKTVAQGGTGVAQQFWAWSEARIESYL